MNFSPIFTFLNTIKALHWATRSHAQHNILDDAFNEFSEKLDEFVECCIGANKVKKFHDVKVSFSLPEADRDDFVQMFEVSFDDLLTALGKYANTSALESLLDDLSNIANKTSYLLAMTTGA